MEKLKKMEINKMHNKFFALRIKQFSAKPVYTTTIKFSQLIKMCKITSREESKKYFQRKVNDENVNKIITFILKNTDPKNNLKITLFPTPIIIAQNQKNYYQEEYLEFDKDNYENFSHDEIFIQEKEDGNIYEINIPKSIDDLFVIVDGQHRFKALETIYNLREKNNKPFDVDLNIMFLFNHTIDEQAEIFTNVNFNQKAMNRSLVYDIFGTSDSYSKNEFKLVNKVLYKLQENPDSVLHGMFKILGNGYGIISQAFFIETLKEIINKSKSDFFDTIKKEINNSIEEKREINDKYVEELVEILENYFKFISSKYNKTWPKKAYKYLIELAQNEKDSTKRNRYLDKSKELRYIENYHSYYYKDPLFKTTGFYALLKIINLIMEKNETIDSDILESCFSNIKALNTSEDLSSYNDVNDIDSKDLARLEGIGEFIYFSKFGDFAKTTGKSKQNELYGNLERLINEAIEEERENTN